MKKKRVLWGLFCLIFCCFLPACQDREIQKQPESLFSSQETSLEREESANNETSSSQPEEEPDLLRAKEILAAMDLPEKVGQMFFVRCPEQNAAEKAAEYHLGGILLFGRDIQGLTAEALSSRIQSYQDNSSLPLFIGVDEEGGTVCRVSANPLLRASRFASPRELYLSGGMEAVLSDSHEKSALLTCLGINVNFAPVCDLSTDPSDFIYPRALGENAEITADYISQVVSAMAEDSMGSVLKHFPGYGPNEDTHTGIAFDKRDYSVFLTEDFLPFQAGIQAGAGMVLVSHNIVASMDEALPASLSPKVHEILREELSFDGVVITDDLSMDAIGDYTDKENAAVLAVLAGNDMLCCTDFEFQIPAVIQAVEHGQIPEEQIDQAVLRILLLKEKLGLI